MMIKIEVSKPDDYNRLMQIWESAVLATHDFLAEKDFDILKEMIATIFFPQVRLFSIIENNSIHGFFGVSDDNLEMLFVDANSRGKHIGKKAIDYVIQELHIYKVDVNEQNLQAIGFYEKIKYHLIGRSETDGMGKPYPLLHFEFQK